MVPVPEKKLNVDKTQFSELALSRFANDVLPAYAPDEGPLMAKQVKALRQDAAQRLPNGKTLSRATLFA